MNGWRMNVLSLVLCLQFFLQVNAMTPIEYPKGNFIRVIGHNLYRVNFEENVNELLYVFPTNATDIGPIYDLGDGKILLESDEGVVSFDTQSKKSAVLVWAAKPIVISDTNKIAYFALDDENKAALFIADIGGNGVMAPVRIASRHRYDPRLLLATSPGEFIFQQGRRVEGIRSKQVTTWKYSAVTGEATLLENIKDCRLLNLWRKKTNEVVCEKISEDPADTYTYLVNLDTGEETKLIDNGKFNVGTYIEELDSAIIQDLRYDKLRLIEHWDLWLYNFKDHSRVKLMNGAGFSPNGFVRVDW